MRRPETQKEEKRIDQLHAVRSSILQDLGRKPEGVDQPVKLLERHRPRLLQLLCCPERSTTPPFNSHPVFAHSFTFAPSQLRDHVHLENWTIGPLAREAAAKRRQQAILIPSAWRLPPTVLASLPSDVRSVPRTCGLLSELEIDITEEEDATVLVRRMASRELKAFDVCIAYCKRAAIAHQLLNCLTEVTFDLALERARSLDAHLERTGKLVGPLHGLPISVKDQFDIKGFDSTMGFVSLIDQHAAQNSVLVDLLHSLGAVILCKTNVPTTLMADETQNNIVGYTFNPVNISLTAGGSSGGEGALVAMKGSIIGVGTDYGGSIRKPAHYCGLVSLRPTSRRLPYEGAVNALRGMEANESVLGPLTNSISSAELFMSALIDAKPWEFDSHVVDRPWTTISTSDIGQRKLRVAVIRDDGMARNHPPLVRGLEEAVAALVSQGHEVVDCPELDFAGALDLSGRISTADGGEDFRSFTDPSGEILPVEVFPITTAAPRTTYEYFQLVKERDVLRQTFLATWRKTADLFFEVEPADLILTVCAPHLAPPPLGRPRPAALIADTALWSMLDLPAATLPVGTIDPKRDVIDPSCRSEAKSEVDRQHWESYKPSTFVNAPIVLQLVNPRRFQEAELLLMTRVLQEALYKSRSTS